MLGCPHDIKGLGIDAYVKLMAGATVSDASRADLVKSAREQNGPIAALGVIQFAPSRPKTRSVKIMRLRKIADNDHGDSGDTSTLVEPNVVSDLIHNRAGNPGRWAVRSYLHDDYCRLPLNLTARSKPV